MSNHNISVYFEKKQQSKKINRDEMIDIEIINKINKKGYELIKLQDEDINKIGKFFNKVFEINQSPRNGITFLKGAIFALGSKYFGNLEWREHCASSLRELLHEWKVKGRISNAFNNVFGKSIENFPNMKNAPDFYLKLEQYYNYFSDICHHNSNQALIHLREIYSDGTIKAGDDDEYFFINTVNNFLILLIKFVNNYLKDF